MYVKLFGGPFDGRQENVIDGCNSLRLPLIPPLTPDDFDTSGTREPGPQFAIYRRKPESPEYFVYEDTTE